MNTSSIVTPPFIDCAGLPADKISHGFFGCIGGVSEGVYGSLNVDLRRNDDPQAVQENRQRILQALDCSSICDDLLLVRQVHGTRCIVFSDASVDGIEDEDIIDPLVDLLTIEADAMVTKIPHLALCMMTADCAPVLFYAKDEDGNPVVGAAHAGWRGAVNGVLEQTIKTMLACGVTRRENIIAIPGPMIGFRSYEVSADFTAPFLAQDPDNAILFAPSRNEGHFMFDFPRYIDNVLRDSNVQIGYTQRKDTYGRKDDDEYFSHRRSVHLQQPDCGRQASVIVIR